MRAFRSFVAVLAGFLLMLAVMRGLGMLVSGPPEDPLGVHNLDMTYLIERVGIAVVAAILGGYLTGWLARSHELAHSAALGLLMIILSVVSMRQAGESAPGWYETAVAGCGPISAMIGAALRMLTKPRLKLNQAVAENANTSAPASLR